MIMCRFAVILLTVHIINAEILLWSPRKILVPALQKFKNEDLTNLLNKLDNPKLVAFKIPSFSIAVQKLFENKFTAYIPNSDINIINITELIGDEVSNYETIAEIIKETTNQYGKNIITLISTSNVRVKRSSNLLADSANTTDVVYSEPPPGPVLYTAKNKDFEAMLFSSKPPLIKTNTSSIKLGKSTSGSLDSRDSYSRLVVTIPIDNGKVTLRFKFPWINSYWSLSSVEYVDATSKTFNLSLLQKDILSPQRFSYHCGGEMVFTDPENGIDLYLYEIQAQPDVQDHRFSDAYNCVPFTTAPIWSGLFVTFILCIGLAVGLAALGSIKTMDKFDNHKTKQLSITVWE